MKKKVVSLILAAAMILGGCGIGSENTPEVKNSETRQNNLIEAETDMSQAHFISAPVRKKEDKGPSEYEASYVMEVTDTAASFVLGDETGEYGELILCEISDWQEGAEFRVKHMSYGKPTSGYEEQMAQLPAAEDHLYNVELKVLDDEMEVRVNGRELAPEVPEKTYEGEQTSGAADSSFHVPEHSLGTVGVYKYRDVTYAFIDDIKVTSQDGILFEDDFDGNFANNLYDYDYNTKATSMFSPYLIHTEEKDGNNRMRISSGCHMTENYPESAPLFRREFALEDKELEAAKLFITALGSVDVMLNGSKAFRDYFAPGKMAFDRRMNYVAYDVTDQLQKDNVLDVYLFHGFYDRGLGYPEAASFWGHRLAVKGLIELTYKDGQKQIIATDDNFKVCTDTRYRADDIYQGEFIDDRHGKDMTFEDVLVDDVDDLYIDASYQRKLNEPIVKVAELKATFLGETDDGRFVYDFGQNFAGTIEIQQDAMAKAGYESGDILAFRYGELINDDSLENQDDATGTVWTENLLSAKATDYYVFEDDADVKISFDHTYHGFRYLEISGAKEPLPEDKIFGIVLSSVSEEDGRFECSDEVLNKFYENSVWSMRANMLDVPTDCPQRDERLGWSGDAQATAGFALYQFGAENFYRHYLEELLAQQYEDGAMPDMVPKCDAIGGHSCWGDAPIVILWDLYLEYGDKELVERHLDGLCHWIEYLVENSEDYLMTSGGYGDHLSLQYTPEALTDTAWCAYSAGLVSKMAQIAGRKELSEKYAEDSDRFADAWRAEFLRDDPSLEMGLFVDGAESETAYVLGLYFGLFPQEQTETAAERLKLLTEYGGYGFFPGYAGMRYYLPALFDNGFADTAIMVMKNTENGGLCNGIPKGMTTNTESLNCLSVRDREENELPTGRYLVEGSLNHAAYSSVAWSFYRDILGIRPDENDPGYRHFFLQPCVSEQLQYASGSHECKYGLIEVEWNSTERHLSCAVPEGTSATLTLPNGEVKELSSGEYEFNW